MLALILVLSWLLPGGIRFIRWRVPLARIVRVRPVRWNDLFRQAIVFGRLPPRRGAIMELRSGRFRSVYISPRDVAAISSQLPGGPFD